MGYSQTDMQIELFLSITGCPPPKTKGIVVITENATKIAPATTGESTPVLDFRGKGLCLLRGEKCVVVRNHGRSRPNLSSQAGINSPRHSRPSWKVWCDHHKRRILLPAIARLTPMAFNPTGVISDDGFVNVPIHAVLRYGGISYDGIFCVNLRHMLVFVLCQSHHVTARPAWIEKVAKP